MRKWKTWQIVLFTLFCMFLNIGGWFLTGALELPIWGDTLGTCLCAYVAGPVCGAVVGLSSNLAVSGVIDISVAYSVTNIAIAFIIGYASKHKWFDKFYGFMKAASLCVFAGLIVSVPLNVAIAGGYTDNKWGDAVINYLLGKNWPQILCLILGQLAIEFADKILTVAIVYLIVLIRRSGSEFKEVGSNKNRLFKGIVPVLLISVTLPFALNDPEYVSAATSTGNVDYNDYVQTVYSSNNGLPCGEANDVAQTNDGVLWIGTYAGLYRYNGREFKWIDEYESVKNVNCLYVDEEGRLWIGTNDNGLSIVIREQLVNVIDQSEGLPSDSVRCIVQSSDGLYYVGTTDSIQVLAMNNGLKAVNTIDDVKYADSITADEYGHVAAVSRDGHLFLMKEGKVLKSIALSNGSEIFKCCTFAPDGKLMVGSSTDHIYCYEITNGDFKKVKVITCENINSINSLDYMDDGTLFMSSDNGIAYFGKSGYNLLNTGVFNNSIDNMIYDYQGNLWFASSRLGLLRLAKSPFKDIYGSLGMERVVVNAVTYWQDSYLYGTDNGLDIVDKNICRQIENDLTEEFAGKRIRCLYVDDRNYLWVCTYGNGLIEIAPDGSKWKYSAEDNSFGNRARVVTGLSDGTILAAGDTGVSYIRDHKVIQSIGNEEGLINSMILTLTELADGSVIAGTDGDGLAVIRDGKVEKMLTRADGLSSEVILRTVKDPKSDGVFIVTSNSLNYLEPGGEIRRLENFPYFNNYDIFIKNENTIFVLSSAGIYVVERDELVSDAISSWELLNARRGLGTSLTANSWTYYNGEGDLYLPCDTGVFAIEVNKYNSDRRAYRMQLESIGMDGVYQTPPKMDAITVGQGVSRLELSPEILNYTTQEPNVGYYLEGYDTQWTIQPQNNLSSIIYINIPAGKYIFHLAIFDNAGEKILEERTFEFEKVGEFYEQPIFVMYMLTLLSLFLIWFTWMIVQRQLTAQEIKLNMANETVMAIANAVDAKDVRTNQHSNRVAEYSVLIAQEMKCFKWWQKNRFLSNLKKAAQMHDIGKIGVPDAVLNKVGRLDDKEYAEMKSHVTRGADILKDFTLVEHVVDGTLYHHERYDGKGYPYGLKGDAIPLYARIIGVADAFDAMTSNRVYRNHMDTEYVMNEMRRGRGAQFDPEALDAFMRLIDKGTINLDKLYAQRRVEIMNSDSASQEELARRVKEDKQIQQTQIKNGTGDSVKTQEGGSQ